MSDDELDCPELERTHALADGELSGAEADAARSHLATCRICQAELADVMQMDASTYERPPANLGPAAREIIRGVYKLKGGLLLGLDEERTADLAIGRSG